MHLSMDTLGIVDDSCLDNYDMAKGAGSSAGGRVHSIDVILGFTKDQDPLLHSVGDDRSQKNNCENPQHPEKQVPSDPYLPELGDNSQHPSYHGECADSKEPTPAPFLQGFALFVSATASHDKTSANVLS